MVTTTEKNTFSFHSKFYGEDTVRVVMRQLGLEEYPEQMTVWFGEGEHDEEATHITFKNKFDLTVNGDPVDAEELWRKECEIPEGIDFAVKIQLRNSDRNGQRAIFKHGFYIELDWEE